MTKQMKRTLGFWSEHGAALPARRGVALMLVVVAMGTATVLTTAYLMSQDNSAAIGANAQDAAASAWTARSGADLALAVLQTELNWVDADPAKLLAGFAIAGGTVSVVLTDMQGMAPDGTETELAMTVVADVNGFKTVLQRIISIQPDGDLNLAVDPEFGEFGVFAVEQMVVDLGSKIAPWPLSPSFKSGAPVKLGMRFIDSWSLELDEDTRMINTELYVRPDASVQLQSMITDGRFAGGAALQVVVPAIPPRMPAALSSGLTLMSDKNLGMDSIELSATLPGGQYQTLRIANTDVTATLDDATGGVYLFDSIDLSDGAVLRINGDVIVGVTNNFKVADGATIELANDTARVRFYVGGNFDVLNAGIGVTPVVARNLARRVEDIVEYVDPSRIGFYALADDAGGLLSPSILVDNASIAMMVVNAPTARIKVKGSSSVVGRLTGERVHITDDSALYYDPALDNKLGITAFNGPYYKSTGEPIDGLVAAMVSYNTTLGLDGFNAYILAHTVEQIDAVVLSAPGDPTPRSEQRAKEKLWPFEAMAIESGSWVPANKDELQTSLYVEIDPTTCDLKQFYDDGVIVKDTSMSGTMEDDKWDLWELEGKWEQGDK